MLKITKGEVHQSFDEDGNLEKQTFIPADDNPEYIGSCKVQGVAAPFQMLPPHEATVQCIVQELALECEQKDIGLTLQQINDFAVDLADQIATI